MIHTFNVQKYFNQFHALKDITFEIGKGEIVGFLGQNGAGKTTLMRLLTTYLPASAGKITVGGFDVRKQSLKVRQMIGYLPETPPLYPQMRVQDYLIFAARLKDIPAREVKPSVEHVITTCDLKDVVRKPIQHLSKGYKQRIGLAQALIHDPAILILDEPTSGLDPIQVQHVRKIIQDIGKERTVLLSTHILSEMEHLAHRIFIIKKGAIITDEKLTDLKQGHATLEAAFLDKIQP